MTETFGLVEIRKKYDFVKNMKKKGMKNKIRM